MEENLQLRKLDARHLLGGGERVNVCLTVCLFSHLYNGMVRLKAVTIIKVSGIYHILHKCSCSFHVSFFFSSKDWRISFSDLTT